MDDDPLAEIYLNVEDVSKSDDEFALDSADSLTEVIVERCKVSADDADQMSSKSVCDKNDNSKLTDVRKKKQKTKNKTTNL